MLRLTYNPNYVHAFPKSYLDNMLQWNDGTIVKQSTLGKYCFSIGDYSEDIVDGEVYIYMKARRFTSDSNLTQMLDNKTLCVTPCSLCNDNYNLSGEVSL